VAFHGPPSLVFSEHCLFACHSERSEESTWMSHHATHQSYWVYILASKPHGTLYIGVTNSLERRVWQHKTGVGGDSFTTKYAVTRLVYFEEFCDPSNAIARETVLKGWLRAKKIALIQEANPLWKDLAEEWYHLQVDSSLRSE
jgi:putative endonuclease